MILKLFKKRQVNMDNSKTTRFIDNDWACRFTV